MTSAVYRWFKPGYAFHELSHYVVARVLGHSASFGVDDDGRPWVDVEMKREAALWRAVAVGVAPAVTGLLFLAAYLRLYLGPLGDVGGMLAAPVHIWLLGNAYVWARPSGYDLVPLRQWVAAFRQTQKPA
ncbi:hypothetical protein [Haloprofundus halobius]|uniref:hypothetical protein n=1 Tax=Haloprofundus halobius TaxID=2876194 RepID=UPI001CCC421C|nr:hypothetical protein [Haloprofundus halobius]